MPDTDLDLPDTGAFVTACRARGITRAVLACQREWAQVPDQAAVDYRRLAHGVLLAYHEGTLLRCPITDAIADPSPLIAHLAKAGITVEERSRNLT